MGVTVTPETPKVVGTRKQVRATVAFDASYPTGGEAVTAAAFGLSEIEEIEPSYAEGRTVVYDRANQKLQVFQGDNDAGADGPGVEVADTTDLSGLDTVRVLVTGY